MCAAKQKKTIYAERGIITRISLQNFVTYGNVVIRPGSNLNLIIGPNGTGKSTIVCAIVLGLGGKPNLVGRGSQPSQYIKADCESATIEIELKDTATKTITLVRSFNMQNKSTWKIDGKNVQGDEVQALIKSLNIQVDNLCQLLPQDKVQDFSKMNPQELLENTERSVGDPKLLEYHTKLKEYRKRDKEIEDTAKNKSGLLDSEEQKYDGMKNAVGMIKEKNIIVKRIKTLKQKRAWISYDLSRKQLCEAKVGRDQAAVEMKDVDMQLRPIRDEIIEIETRVKSLKKDVEKHNTDLHGKTSKVDKALDEIQNKEREIREVERNREHKIHCEENRDQEIRAVAMRKDKLENDLTGMTEDLGTEETLVSTNHKISQKLELQRRDADKLVNMKNSSKYEEEQINEQIRSIKAEMQSAKDVEAKRLELLRMKSHDAHQAVMWLRQNRDKFVATIHEPMLLNIHVKDANYSKYFETIISQRDLLAFVCEDKSDMNRLLGYVRDELKLTINVVHSEPNAPVSTAAKIPINDLRQYGFQHYLISLIEAPETIIKYLVLMYNIHNIPIGTSIVEDNVDNVPKSLRMFFSLNNIYSVSVSKYTGAKSIRSATVVGNNTLSIILDTAKLRTLTERIEPLNAKKTKIAEALGAIETELKTSNKELDELRTAKQQSQRNVQTIRTLKTRIQMAERKIEELQNERTSVEEIKAAANGEIKNLMKKQLQVYKEYNSYYSDCYKFITANEETKLRLKHQQHIYVTKNNASQDLRERCSALEQTYKKLDSQLQPLRRETQTLYAIATESTENLNPTDKQFKTYHTAFAKLPFTIEEIEIELETARAKVYCLGKNADGEEILRNYEKAEANIKKFNEELEKLAAERAVIQQKIEETRTLWITPLQSLVDKINENFSEYFSLMGCAGEITLDKGDNIDDFDKYGLMIRVKFRDADELQVLTRKRQSGGERAVTTAVYMIALQELSKVPFRCVDEINQGMDAMNERRIFELIVEITGRANSCQYFLLTPKLLPDLEYGENMTIHCVYNGAFVIPSSEFDVARYSKKLERC